MKQRYTRRSNTSQSPVAIESSTMKPRILTTGQMHRDDRRSKRDKLHVPTIISRHSDRQRNRIPCYFRGRALDEQFFYLQFLACGLVLGVQNDNKIILIIINIIIIIIIIIVIIIIITSAMSGWPLLALGLHCGRHVGIFLCRR